MGFASNVLGTLSPRFSVCSHGWHDSRVGQEAHQGTACDEHTWAPHAAFGRSNAIPQLPLNEQSSMSRRIVQKHVLGKPQLISPAVIMNREPSPVLQHTPGVIGKLGLWPGLTSSSISLHLLTHQKEMRVKIQV